MVFFKIKVKKAELVKAHYKALSTHLERDLVLIIIMINKGMKNFIDLFHECT